MRSDYPLVFRRVGLWVQMGGFGFCAQTKIDAGLDEATKRGLQVLGVYAQRRSWRTSIRLLPIDAPAAVGYWYPEQVLLWRTACMMV